MDTIQKQILDLLSEMEMTAIDLSQELGIREKEVLPTFPMLFGLQKLPGRC